MVANLHGQGFMLQTNTMNGRFVDTKVNGGLHKEVCNWDRAEGRGGARESSDVDH